MSDDGVETLEVGCEVSAKYRGAYCEATIKNIDRLVKVKVKLKESNSYVNVQADQIVGTLQPNEEVQVRHHQSGNLVPALVSKVYDASSYTVQFDDGDERTLKRSQLCLMSEPHFKDDESLDELPLTNPEQFSSPVAHIKSSASSESSSASLDVDFHEWVGKVVCVYPSVSAQKKSGSTWFPALIIRSSAHTVTLKPREMLARSFKDNRFVVFRKSVTKPFSRSIALKHTDRTMVSANEKALLFQDCEELPYNWSKTDLLGIEDELDDDGSDSDEEDDTLASEQRDHFVAQLFKFMDDRGTPINNDPTVNNKDLDLYKLFTLVQHHGGYNRVTNQLKWLLIYSKMKLPLCGNASHAIRNAYNRYLYAFENFYRQLGNMMETTTLSSSRQQARSSRRSLLPFRDRMVMSPSKTRETHASIKDEEEREKPTTTRKLSKSRKNRSKGEESPSTSPNRESEGKKTSPRLTRKLFRRSSGDLQQTRSQVKVERETPRRTSLRKRSSMSECEKEDTNDLRASGRSGSVPKDEAPPQEGKSSSSNDGSSTSSSKRKQYNLNPDRTAIHHDDDEDQLDDDEYPEPYAVGTTLRVCYGRDDLRKYYDAKVTKIHLDDDEKYQYRVHYFHWNPRYDEWISKVRVVRILERVPVELRKEMSEIDRSLNEDMSDDEHVSASVEDVKDDNDEQEQDDAEVDEMEENELYGGVVTIGRLTRRQKQQLGLSHEVDIELPLRSSKEATPVPQRHPRVKVEDDVEQDESGGEEQPEDTGDVGEEHEDEDIEMKADDDGDDPQPTPVVQRRSKRWNKGKRRRRSSEGKVRPRPSAHPPMGSDTEDMTSPNATPQYPGQSPFAVSRRFMLPPLPPNRPKKYDFHLEQMETMAPNNKIDFLRDTLQEIRKLYAQKKADYLNLEKQRKSTLRNRKRRDSCSPELKKEDSPTGDVARTRDYSSEDEEKIADAVRGVVEMIMPVETNVDFVGEQVDSFEQPMLMVDAEDDGPESETR